MLFIMHFTVGIEIMAKVAIKSGMGFGTLIAIILSWSTWHSILWVIVHGLLGWLYVFYWAIKYW